MKETDNENPKAEYHAPSVTTLETNTGTASAKGTNASELGFTGSPS